MSKEVDAIQAGQAAASMLFDALRATDASIEDDTERLFWWVGFFGSLGGFAAGSLGTEAIQAISKMTSDTTQKVLDKVSH